VSYPHHFQESDHSNPSLIRSDQVEASEEAKVKQDNNPPCSSNSHKLLNMRPRLHTSLKQGR
jgi:hypothetical protein